MRKGLLVAQAALLLGLTAVGFSAHAAVNLQFWSWYTDPAFRKPMEQILADFHKENPDIRVTHSTYDFGTIGDKYLATVVGGTAPDVVLVSSRWMVQMAYAKAFAQLDPYIARDKFDTKDVYKYLWNGVTYQGSVYAMPFAGGNQQALWYNQDMFAEVGLDRNANPRTFTELANAAMKLTRDKNGDGKIDVCGIDGTVYFPSMLLAAGGDWTAKDGSKVLWNSPQGVAALSYMCDLANKYKVTGGFAFEQGKAGIHLEGPYYMSRIRRTGKFVPGLGIHPQADDAKEIRMWASSDALALSTKPKVRMEAGWKLIKYLMRPDVQAKWAILTGFPPQVRSATLTKQFKDAVVAEPLLGVGAGLSEYATCFYPCIQDRVMESLVTGYTAQAVASKMSPLMALNRATDEANRLLSRFFFKPKK